MRALAMTLIATAGCAFTPSGLSSTDGDGGIDAATVDAPGSDGVDPPDAADIDGPAAMIDAATIDAPAIDAPAIDAPAIDAPTTDPFCTGTGLEACFRMNQGSGAPIDGHTPPITIARADAVNYIPSCPNHGTALDLSAGVYVRTGAPATALSNLTAEAWVKLNSVPAFLDGRRYWFDADNSWGLSYATDAGGTVRVQCLIVLGTANVPTVQGPLPNPTNWNHVACTWDGDRLRLFINGTRTETNVSGTSNPIAGAGAGVQIGRDGVDQNGATEGQMDDVRLWSRRVPDAEIQATANAGCQ